MVLESVWVSKNVGTVLCPKSSIAVGQKALANPSIYCGRNGWKSLLFQFESSQCTVPILIPNRTNVGYNIHVFDVGWRIEIDGPQS